MLHQEGRVRFGSPRIRSPLDRQREREIKREDKASVRSKYWRAYATICIVCSGGHVQSALRHPLHYTRVFSPGR